MKNSTQANAAFKSYFSMPFERGVMNIEYSVLSDFHGREILAGNTEMHFRKSLEEGFDGVKADMRMTSDGEIVLCHDPGYTFNAEGQITRFDREKFVAIHDLPLAKVLSLEFEQPFEGKILHPCTLDTMLSVCAEMGAVAYLTLRPEPWRPQVAKRMAELVLAHEMKERTIINLFTGQKEAVDCVSALMPNLVYCNTRLSTDPLTRELIDSSAVDGYQVICLYYPKQFETMTPELCQYAESKGIRIWAWGARNREEVAATLASGISGFQMYNREVNNAVIAELLRK